MNRTNITIPSGGMYQKWSHLMDLVEDDTAKRLERLANTRGWCKVKAGDAIVMGFGELASWSMPETDELVLIDNNYLVCLHKENHATN